MREKGKITAICNQKGGVGKTVTTVSLGIGLARAGKKVLLVDVDAQGSLTASLGYQHPDQMKNTLAEMLGRIISDEPVSMELRPRRERSFVTMQSIFPASTSASIR